MSISKTIRISKLQSKNRMVGKTFNPRGNTIESLNKRDSDYLEKFNNMNEEEQERELLRIIKHSRFCDEKCCSHPFEEFLLKNSIERFKEMKVNEIIEKINSGLTFRTFNEFGELETEYYIDREIYTKGTFHFKHTPTFNIFNLEELKEELKEVCF